MADDKKLDWRQKKALEEARKAGTAEPELDEKGEPINPHIPAFMKDAPWYIDTGRPTLQHQRKQASKEQKFDKIGEWYARGAKVQTTTKFRKGACENCGAMTHKTIDCCERPRKVTAKMSGKNVAPDEVIKEVKLSYDGKHDRWNGYDPNSYNQVKDWYDKTEKERRQLKEAEISKKLESDIGTDQPARRTIMDSDSDSDIESDNEKKDYLDENSKVMGTNKDRHTKISTKNLRQREDVANYLYNLDPNSAYYDPKSHSIKDNPIPGSDKTSFISDKWVKASQTNTQINRMHLHLSKQDASGMHLLATPTLAEITYQKEQQKKVQESESHQKLIEERYGKQAAPTLAKGLAQTEIRKKDLTDKDVAPCSKYIEDEFPGNHTSVWGSYWRDGQWGYKCCHSFIRNAYCTGELGKRVTAASSTTSNPTAWAQRQTPSADEKENHSSHTNVKSDNHNNNTKKDDSTVKKRSFFNSGMEANAPTEEEMDEYRQSRNRFDDPMANYQSSSNDKHTKDKKEKKEKKGK